MRWNHFVYLSLFWYAMIIGVFLLAGGSLIDSLSFAVISYFMPFGGLLAIFAVTYEGNF